MQPGAVPPPALPKIAPPVAQPRSLAKVAALANDTPAPAEPVTKQRSGWLIQVGALPDETEARQRLEAARSKAKALLGKADPFTERTEKGDKVLYRARFAGLEKNQAEAACKHLKRSDIPCMLLKN
jgi:D-alanyl-D-alanine carboxypeptidase